MHFYYLTRTRYFFKGNLGSLTPGLFLFHKKMDSIIKELKQKNQGLPADHQLTISFSSTNPNSTFLHNYSFNQLLIDKFGSEIKILFNLDKTAATAKLEAGTALPRVANPKLRPKQIRALYRLKAGIRKYYRDLAQTSPTTVPSTALMAHTGNTNPSI